jgi:Ca2+-binding EF-hand superfamily protein
VSFNGFLSWIESNCAHEFTPEQLEQEMKLFDEDKNGFAVREDVERVLATYTNLSMEDREHFVKLCCIGGKLNDQQKGKTVKQLGLPEQFDIKRSVSHLFNV